MSKIKKLFYSVFVAFISIGVNSDIEARVTKEVAEATLPYLMEAAGIPGDVEDVEHAGEEKTTVKANAVWYAKSKIIAILDMIYTDEGQQQMVNWAVNDIRPQILGGERAPFSEIWPAESSNLDQENGEKLFQILFPCKTGTFTSFANHTSRFGYTFLNQYSAIYPGIRQWISDGKEYKPARKVLINSTLQGENLDIKLARIIFVLDILDDVTQLNEILGVNIQAGNSQSEYFCRPVSAIIANGKGDCIENLYKHLINISIQDPRPSERHQFHTERLPISLQLYFNQQRQGTHSIKEISEAGRTSVDFHNLWQIFLRNFTEGEVHFNCSTGTLRNISRTLYNIAFWNVDQILSLHEKNERELIQIIENSMNKLAALNNGNTRFTTSLSKRLEDDPSWISSKLIIKDIHAGRTITIGICDSFDKNFGHAEILSIQ